MIQTKEPKHQYRYTSAVPTSLACLVNISVFSVTALAAKEWQVKQGIGGRASHLRIDRAVILGAGKINSMIYKINTISAAWQRGGTNGAQPPPPSFPTHMKERIMVPHHHVVRSVMQCRAPPDLIFYFLCLGTPGLDKPKIREGGGMGKESGEVNIHVLLH